MNEYLLDTHTLIWSLTMPSKISDSAKSIIESPDTIICVNAISFWEVSLKYRLGKLIIDPYNPAKFPAACRELNFNIEPLNPDITSTFFELPIIDDSHKDPFDRILVWIALNSNRPIISKDSSFKFYHDLGLKTIW